MTSVPPTQPPAAKCDYCDQRATTLAGDTNGVLVCEDHVRLFAEREIAAAIDATQPPAAPETDVRLTEDERVALAKVEFTTWAGQGERYDIEWADHLLPAVERIVAERVRVVEGERDALDERVDTLRDELSYAIRTRDEWKSNAEDAEAHAFTAEAAHAELVAAVEALADEWAEDYPGPTAACNRTPDEWARDLRALLAGGAR